jgi:hypothetical protein
VRFHSDGRTFHHATFLRVRSLRHADSVLATLATWTRDQDRPIDSAASIGGVEGAEPDGFASHASTDTYAELELEPGYYLIVCTVRGAAASLHVNQGMHALLHVLPNPNGVSSRRAPPKADLTVRTSDYSYQLSVTVLRPGWHLIAVDNGGPSEHVTEFVRLRPNHHITDLLRGEAEDPIAGAVGGMPRLKVGERAYAWVYVERGTYAIHCPLRAPAGWRHEERGMMAELSVR